MTLLASCAKNRPSEPLFNEKIPPPQVVSINDNGESVVNLTPINSGKWNNPELERMELAIKASREARSEARLESLKEERMTFSTPKITFKTNGQKEITFNVLYNGSVEAITFISPSSHHSDFMFTQTSGFSARSVTLQGMCLSETEACDELAVQIAYKVGSLKITKQFTVENPNAVSDSEDENDEEEDSSLEGTDGITGEESEEEDDDGDVAADVNDEETTLVDSALEEEDDGPASEEVTSEGTVNNDGATAADTEADSAPVTSAIKDALEQEEVTPVNLQTPNKAVPSEDDNLVVQGEETSAEPADVQPTTPDIPLIDEADTVSPIEIALNAEPVDVVPAVDNSDTQGSPIRPKARPENLVTDQAEQSDSAPLTSSIRPKARPADLDTTSDADLSTGAGQIIFPELATDAEVDSSFNVDSAEVTTTGPITSDVTDELLNSIKTTVFNQAKRFYARRSGRNGLISDSSQLKSRITGATVNPHRRSRQHASGILTKTLEYAAMEFNQSYANSSVCINDLSRENGGLASGHGSHQNGLDADISYPSTANSCSGNVYFKDWETMKGRDSAFMEKQWKFINTLLKTDRIHVIFLSGDFANSLCRYVKANVDISKTNRNKIFKKLHHIKGHRNHYHVRMKCNRQNSGCVTQGVLRGKTCN